MPMGPLLPDTGWPGLLQFYAQLLAPLILVAIVLAACIVALRRR